MTTIRAKLGQLKGHVRAGSGSDSDLNYDSGNDSAYDDLDPYDTSSHIKVPEASAISKEARYVPPPFSSAPTPPAAASVPSQPGFMWRFAAGVTTCLKQNGLFRCCMSSARRGQLAREEEKRQMEEERAADHAQALMLQTERDGLQRLAYQSIDDADVSRRDPGVFG